MDFFFGLKMILGMTMIIIILGLLEISGKEWIFYIILGVAILIGVVIINKSFIIGKLLEMQPILKYILVIYIGISAIFGIFMGIKCFVGALFSVLRHGRKLKYFVDEKQQKLYEEQKKIFSKNNINHRSWYQFKAIYNDNNEVGKDELFEIAYDLGLTSGSLLFRHYEERRLERLTMHEKNKIVSTAHKKNYVYENSARKSYFLGPCFEDISDIIKRVFKNLDQEMPDRNKGLIPFILLVFLIISMYTVGLTVTLLFSTIIFSTSMFFTLCNLAIYITAMIVQKVKLKIKKISYRCPVCKRVYYKPVYMCPNTDCSILHVDVSPGKYGIFKRKCVCGKAKLPLTTKAKGYVIDSVSNKKKKIRLKDMESFCPYCEINGDNGTKAALSRPLSIQLIGAASAGKTTFKVAYVYDFLENEAFTSKFEYDEWPDEKSKNEYDTYEYYYKGKGVLAATQTGTGDSGEDITTFSFRLSHKKMSADRLVQIYDMPGERFREGYAKEGWNNYTFSEGAVFLMDPYSLSKVREENKEAVNNPAYTQVDMNELIDSFIKTLRQLRLKMQNKKFVLPIALSINKADTITLRKQVGKFAVDNLMKMYPDVFKERHVAMDYACRCFLQKNEGGNFIMNLDNNFANVHFFSSSPYGSPNAIKYKPENVMEIMRWLLVRADKEFGNLWVWDKNNGREEIRDLTDEEKKLYITHREYYENAVEKNL